MQKDLLEYMPELLELTKVARSKGVKMSVDYTNGFEYENISVYVFNSTYDDIVYSEHITTWSRVTTKEVINDIKEVLDVEN